MHIIGLIVVTMLISAVALGSRLQTRTTAPTRPEEQPRRPLTDRLPGVTSERRRPVAVPTSTQRQRLRPHQLRGRTEPVPAREDG
ncbi:DUF6479 family protein [Streptomyces sp. NPDC059491]|uniref:DUF6479 family protein n=1 Tax=unclassified Streptomyces TaxID=2593676 RepID=UPI0036C43A90